jgi:hypothetical protein
MLRRARRYGSNDIGDLRQQERGQPVNEAVGQHQQEIAAEGEDQPHRDEARIRIALECVGQQRGQPGFSGPWAR